MSVALDARPVRITAVRAVPRDTSRPTLMVVAMLISMVVVFGLPHALIPRLLGPHQTYTPFAVTGVSALTFDKTSTYAAQLNYMVSHRAWAYDTDIFEYRDAPSPVATAPYIPLALGTVILGGVDRAIVAADVVLPALACLILFALLLELTSSWRISLVGALVTILVSFGPRNFLNVPLAILAGHRDTITQPLEYSRLLHPEMSFTVLAAGLLFLWRGLRYGRKIGAIVAGVFGGLQFYSYVYYWPVWVAACVLLLLGAWNFADRPARLAMAITNATTWLVGIPFWIIFAQNRTADPFVNVIARHIDGFGRIPPPEKIVYTLVSIAIFTTLAVVFATGSRYQPKVLMFLTAVFGASVAALNMELTTGFNVESMLHFPNRLFQPLFSLAAFALLIPTVAARLPLPRLGSATTGAALVGLIGVALIRQVAVSVNVAPQHALPTDQNMLFTWLNQNSHVGDVVVAEAPAINELLPVATHDRPFVPYGERTSADYDEIMRRFLTGMKLLQRPPEEVRSLLAQDHDQAQPPVGLTYTYVLFTGGHGISNWRLPDDRIASALQQYQSLDLAAELGRQKVNFVYAPHGEEPASVPGWTFTPVYDSGYGALWRIGPAN